MERSLRGAGSGFLNDCNHVACRTDLKSVLQSKYFRAFWTLIFLLALLAEDRISSAYGRPPLGSLLQTACVSGAIHPIFVGILGLPGVSRPSFPSVQQPGRDLRGPVTSRYAPILYGAPPSLPNPHLKLAGTANTTVTLRRSATTCNDLQRRATTCNDLQRPATTCNDLQRSATRCNDVQ